jgi:hypothetical protein
VGSWTGKYDPARIATDWVTKKTGVKPIAGWAHEKIANAAHRTADSAFNQEPEGTENAKRNKFLKTYGRTAQERADRAQRVTTIMRSA